MSAYRSEIRTPPSAPLLALAGLALVACAWLLPVNLKSVAPTLLKAAGEGTPSAAELGLQLVESEKLGPAALVLRAARTVGDPGAPTLAASLDAAIAREPSLAAWGGWDPFLDPLFHLRSDADRPAASTPVLTLFLPEQARAKLAGYLRDSGSFGVQDLLRLRDITVTGRFVPASRPGGQPLDALILLAALLYQGDHLAPPLQRELRRLAETAVEERNLGELEPFFLDLLSLGRRLDWVQLSELLGRADSIRTVGEYAQLARVASDQFPVLYAAAFFSDSADSAASYLLRYGRPGADDLSLALGDGQGAVRQLLLRQVPVNRQAGPALGWAAALVLEHPQLMLAAKYLGYLIGLFLALRGLDLWAVAPGEGFKVAAGASRIRAGILATLLAALLVIVTEPFLLKAAPPSDYQLQIRLPMLMAAATASPAPPSATSSFATMDLSTIVSIGIFALLQVVMYTICLRKINEIDQKTASPQLKFRLMENEENLFDSGLYVGMMGTATALVLQVLGVIQPNLLAAYSSNLFGIVCVALVKIRHVRGFRTRLILQIQAATAA